MIYLVVSLLCSLYIYEDELLGKEIMRDVILAKDFNYWGENDLSYLLKYRDRHIDEIDDEVRMSLFYKYLEKDSIDKDLIQDILLGYSWSAIGGLMVDFEQRIVIWFFEYGINLIIVDEQKRNTIEEKYRKYIAN